MTLALAVTREKNSSWEDCKNIIYQELYVPVSVYLYIARDYQC